MLEQINLTNFQRYASLEVSFAPVTVFVGPSDTGKSTLIRALQWLAFNEGAMSDLMRHGETACEASLAVDGRILRRTRTKAANGYVLDGVPLMAVGKGGVPDAVAELLNVTEANFQAQHDPPFWLAATAGEVSRELNAIVDLGIIDTSLAAAAAGVQAAKAEQAAAEARRERAKIAVEALAWVETAAAAWQAVELAYKDKQAAQADLASLKALMQAAREAGRLAASRKMAATALLAVALAGRNADAAAGRLAALHALTALIRRLAAMQAPSVEVVAAIGAAGRQAAAVAARAYALRAALQAARKATAAYATATQLREAADAELSAIELCPSCGRPL